MEEKLKFENKLKLIKALEDIRWKVIDEEFKNKPYPETKFYYDDKLFKYNNIKDITPEKAEAILLTHWLIYICNRQMDYKHIFKAGGYVISSIVSDFLNLNNKSVQEILENHFGSEQSNKEDKIYLKVSRPDEGTKIYKYFEKKELLKKDICYFASRFMKTDFVCMYKTLNNLESTSFSKYLQDNSSSISNLAEGLYDLTYRAISNKYEGNNVEDIIKSYETINESRENNHQYNFENGDNKYTSKRLWCVIRDFLRHPLFSKCFKTIVSDDKFKTLFTEYKTLELPGDVWNNNSDFANCFWGKELVESYKKIFNDNFNSSLFVRSIYKDKIAIHKRKYQDAQKTFNDAIPKEEIKSTETSPIDFDITFNFVPNMCDGGNCDICPLAKYSCDENKKEKDSDLKNIMCHKIEGKYCTFVLFALGIRYKCTGKECTLKEYFDDFKKKNNI